MAFPQTRPDGFMLSEDQALLDLDRCYEWLAGSYWASDRSRETMERSFQNSLVIGAYSPSGEQIGLARAVTDGVTFAWLADVYVDESARGRGIGTWMTGELVAALKANGLRRFMLGTRDAHGVYAKVGFTAPRVPQVLMELDERPTRPNGEDVDPAAFAGRS
ncbi:MAG TPA: GNAT family N-acetyltransferase [Jatrophihabitans sp.]|jgi:GNAT superfamily N-acetyltransferase